MRKKYFRSLFFKAVVVLSAISVIPVLFIGYRVVRVNSRLFKNELLQKQQVVAGRLGAAVEGAISSKEQLLLEFGDLHTDFGSHLLITQPDLAYLQSRSPSLFYLTVFTASGKPVFDSGTLPGSHYDQLHEAMMKTCLSGLAFVSDVYYQGNRPFIWLAQPLHRQAGDSPVTGVLAAAVYLQDISKTLLQTYPLDLDVILVSGNGDFLSYNGSAEELAPGTTYAAQLRQTLQAVNRQLNGQEQGEVTLPNGKKILVCVAQVGKVGWKIYVFQAADVPAKLFADSLFHSALWDIAVMVFVMLLFVGVVSYLVIIPITRPLARLRMAAIKLSEDENFVVHPQDVDIPHNEIGDLARVFVDMSKTLHQRRQELIGTQQELARMNQVLEERVEQRTRQLKKASADLVKAERLVAIGQMASIISHEIRNPLAVISNATRLIKTLVQPTDQKLNKQFSIIEDEIRQANGIISEVLGYARSRELMLSTVDVNSYLREIIQSYPVRSGIVFKEELNAPDVRIKIDAEEIKQALRNIITNAVEAMPAGGTVVVGAKAGRQIVCLYIRDSGPGVKEEIKKEIFAPFFTTKARGTGLGLAVVRKAVTRHRGKVFISSQAGKGACFQIYLKIYRSKGDTSYG